MAMKIMRGKPSWHTIERIKQHHEDNKHKSFCLTPSLLLDFICNHRHELYLDLWESEIFCKEKFQARKEKKMACFKPYEKM
jgi:AAA15 family ATPase/GTPase